MYSLLVMWKRSEDCEAHEHKAGRNGKLQLHRQTAVSGKLAQSEARISVLILVLRVRGKENIKLKISVISERLRDSTGA